MSKPDQFSANRLNGEPVPGDLQLLLDHADELENLTGIQIPLDEQWAPWSDTSYLSAADLRDPGIVANVKAIEKVCSLITFVAQDDEGAYLGYWRGPSGRRIADSPLVSLDNEGQFYLCSGNTFAETILSRHEECDELQEWLASLGALAEVSMGDSVPEESPGAMHWRLQKEYSATT